MTGEPRGEPPDERGDRLEGSQALDTRRSGAAAPAADRAATRELGDQVGENRCCLLAAARTMSGGRVRGADGERLDDGCRNSELLGFVAPYRSTMPPVAAGDPRQARRTAGSCRFRPRRRRATATESPVAAAFQHREARGSPRAADQAEGFRGDFGAGAAGGGTDIFCSRTRRQVHACVSRRRIGAELGGEEIAQRAVRGECAPGSPRA